MARAGAFGARLAFRASSVYHLAHPFGPFRGFVEAQRPSLSQQETSSEEGAPSATRQLSGVRNMSGMVRRTFWTVFRDVA